MKKLLITLIITIGLLLNINNSNAEYTINKLSAEDKSYLKSISIELKGKKLNGLLVYKAFDKYLEKKYGKIEKQYDRNNAKQKLLNKIYKKLQKSNLGETKIDFFSNVFGRIYDNTPLRNPINIQTNSNNIDSKITLKEYEKQLGVDKIKLEEKKKESIKHLGANNLYYNGMKNGYILFHLKISENEKSNFNYPLDIMSKELQDKLNNNNFEIGVPILAIIGERKEPIDFLQLKQYDSIVENITLEEYKNFVNKFKLDHFNMSGLFQKVKNKKEATEIIEYLINRKKNKDDYELPYTYRRLSNGETFSDTISELDKLSIGYYQLKNGEVYINFVRVKHLYTKQEKRDIMQGYNIEIRNAPTKEMKDKVYLKYRNMSEAGKYIYY